MTERVMVPTASLIRDVRFQARCLMNTETVQAYTDWYLEHEGEDLAVIQVVKVDDDYFIVDGFHRHCAAEAAGREHLLCDVTEGTYQDAVIAAAKANETNGLSRTSADKIRAVMMLLDLPGWENASKRKLAEGAGVSRWTVSKALDIIRLRTSAQTVPVDDRPDDDEMDKPQVNILPKSLDEDQPIPQRKVIDAPVSPWREVASYIDQRVRELSALRADFRSSKDRRSFNRIAYYQPDLCRHIDNCLKIMRACIPNGKCGMCRGTGVMEAGIDCHRCHGSGYSTEVDASVPTRDIPDTDW